MNFGQVSSLSLWLNNLPAGKTVTCYLSPIKALPLSKSLLHRPQVTVGGKTILLPIDLESGSYLEMNSVTDCKVYGPKGELKLEAKPEGEIPALQTGKNEIRFTCEPNEGANARANVTVISEGAPLGSSAAEANSRGVR